MLGCAYKLLKGVKSAGPGQSWWFSWLSAEDV